MIAYPWTRVSVGTVLGVVQALGFSMLGESLAVFLSKVLLLES